MLPVRKADCPPVTTSQRPAVSACFDSEVLSSRIWCPAGLGEVSAVVLQQSLRDVESAYRNFFATLDKVVEDLAVILASNTSSIPIMKLAGATGRPDQVMGTHFFNPVPAMPLVELVGSLHTSDASMDRAESGVAQTLGKQPIRPLQGPGRLRRRRAAGAVSAVRVRMVETGFATVEDVGQGMVLGCSHPMGPLRLTDMVGLDVVAAVADALYEEFKEPLYAAPPLLSRMVEGGLLGRKSGRGFYPYP